MAGVFEQGMMPLSAIIVRPDIYSEFCGVFLLNKRITVKKTLA